MAVTRDSARVTPSECYIGWVVNRDLLPDGGFAAW